MNLSSLIKNILKSQKFDNQISEILSFFKPLKLNKNNFLVKQGEICPYFCFVESGILQHVITEKNEDKTTYFATKNTCTSVLKSFIQETPSRKNIKALNDCSLQVVTLRDFTHLLKNNEAFKEFYYKLIENQIFLIDDYRIDLLTLTPEERYTKLLKNQPQLLQEVSLHYLASFLGISTRHMSRIRKNIK